MKKWGIFCMILILFAPICVFCGCEKRSLVSGKSHAISIGNVNYASLFEAVQSSKEGDTIKIYDDVMDNKNIYITRPINIEGVKGSNRIKPKFYGSLTIDMDGQDDVVKIEDLEIIHDGVKKDGEGNDLRVGVTLLNGGLSMSGCKVAVDSKEGDGGQASGVVISRKEGSKSITPISLKGNTFDGYKVSDELLTAALIIKSNKSGEFQKLNLKADKIYNENSFASNLEGNQLVFVDYDKNSYPYLVTSSSDTLLDALLKNQDEAGSTFRLSNFNPPKNVTEKNFDIKANTELYMEGNNTSKFTGKTFNVYGCLTVSSCMEEATIVKAAPSASIILEEGADPEKSKFVM